MRRTRKIAVVMELDWPYKRHYEVFAGIRDYAAEHGNWQLVLGNYPQYELSRGEHYDGIVGRISANCYEAATQAEVPMVNVMIDSPVASKVSGVQLDFRAAGRLCAEHFAARGMQRFAHFGFKGSTASKLHFEGMCEVARKHGFPCSSHLVVPHFAETEKLWTRFVEYTTKAQASWQAPLGVGFASDELAHAVWAICIAKGWKIPDQLAMVGTNNETLICNAGDPSLSSIEMADRRCGYEAARLLDRLMRNPDLPHKIHYLPPKGMVLRRSSDAYAVDDQAVVKALSYMAEHSNRKISVSDIAKSVGIGRQALEQRFRKLLHRTINEELIRIRISNMKRLLVEADKTIGEISDQVGFGTTANMHVMFKRLTGLTPIAYREKHNPDSKVR